MIPIRIQIFPQLMERYIRKGKLKYVFRDFPLARAAEDQEKKSEAK